MWKCRKSALASKQAGPTLAWLPYNAHLQTKGAMLFQEVSLDGKKTLPIPKILSRGREAAFACRSQLWSCRVSRHLEVKPALAHSVSANALIILLCAVASEASSWDEHSRLATGRGPAWPCSLFCLRMAVMILRPARCHLSLAT